MSSNRVEAKKETELSQGFRKTLFIQKFANELEFYKELKENEGSLLHQMVSLKTNDDLKSDREKLKKFKFKEVDFQLVLKMKPIAVQKYVDNLYQKEVADEQAKKAKEQSLLGKIFGKPDSTPE